MKVKRVELLPGCVLTKDVYSKSATPIIARKTVLSHEHLEVLKVFLIDVVEVEPVLTNGEAYTPEKVVSDEHQDQQVSHVNPLVSSYLQGVNQFKELFQSWQQGKNVDIFSVLGFFNPLIEKFIQYPNDLFNLYHYAGTKGYIYHHSVSVGLMSAYLAQKLKFSKKEIFEVGLAGLLADCGMTKLPPRLYEKPNQLSKNELLQLERHPVYGYQMLKDLPAVKESVFLAVLQHHERLNGSGYPFKFKGEKLHAYGRIIAVIDVFHAMICIRPYRPKQSPFKVLELMNQEQFGQFDHKALSLLTDEVVRLSVGTKVRLTNHDVGQIVFTERNQPTRPIIQLENGSTISLKNHRDLYIEEIL